VLAELLALVEDPPLPEAQHEQQQLIPPLKTFISSSLSSLLLKAFNLSFFSFFIINNLNIAYS
jgi:hypothetical protein